MSQQDNSINIGWLWQFDPIPKPQSPCQIELYRKNSHQLNPKNITFGVEGWWIPNLELKFSKQSVNTLSLWNPMTQNNVWILSDEGSGLFIVVVQRGWTRWRGSSIYMKLHLQFEIYFWGPKVDHVISLYCIATK